MEALLIERNAALSETCEEWDQCEKKFKETKQFLEKTRESLDNITNRKRPLRDQHLTCETIVADIAIQKEKIVLSVEKLEVSVDCLSHSKQYWKSKRQGKVQANDSI